MMSIIEIRSYNLQPGKRKEFHRLVTEHAIPLLRKWEISVVAFGPSLHDENSYFLIRSYRNVEDMEKSEKDFYSSEDWTHGPRDSVLALIINHTTIVLPEEGAGAISIYLSNFESDELANSDSALLSSLNYKFIKNFLTQDVKSHSEMIHHDFVCIESSGDIVPRNVYLKNWATDYADSGYLTFNYEDEFIRIFNHTALVRARTVYTKRVDGKLKEGATIYTDTYLKEKGKWQCIQVQITPVLNK